MDALTALYLALEETPGDKLALMALADCYLEEGQPDAAACVRWSLARGRHPYQYRAGTLTVSSEAWGDGFWWWCVEDPQLARSWGFPAACRLPRGMWRRLPHYFDYSPSVFKQYPTPRGAYEALFVAWPLTGAYDRAVVDQGRRS